MAADTEAPISNAERAERARRAAEAYNYEDDVDSNMIDFLADLQHYCHIARAADIGHRTFGDLLETARQHFDAEITGEE
jgi:hypothetical protein